MNNISPREALERFKKACEEEGYDYRGRIGEDLKLYDLLPVFEMLVNKYESETNSLQPVIKNDINMVQIYYLLKEELGTRVYWMYDEYMNPLDISFDFNCCQYYINSEIINDTVIFFLRKLGDYPYRKSFSTLSTFMQYFNEIIKGE